MQATFDSPIGRLLITEEDGCLTSLDFSETAERLLPFTPLLARACKELEEYFSGRRMKFSLPLRPAGTEFQRQVWQGLLQIPYGETCTYGALAAAIGAEKACRAVGGANGKNPLPILIPCHRAVASGEKLGGFSYGLWRKEYLLSLENKHAKKR